MMTQMNGEKMEKTYPIAPVQIKFTRQSRFPEQHGHCFWCGAELKGRRKAYCRDSHRRNYYKRYTWEGVREYIYKREKGICQDCKELTFFKQQGGSDLDLSAEIDHIIPISKGGVFWDYDNLILYCHKCHVQKTHKDLYPQKYAFKPQPTLLEFFTK